MAGVVVVCGHCKLLLTVSCDDDLSPPQLGGTFRSLPALGVGGFALLGPPDLSLDGRRFIGLIYKLMFGSSRISLTPG